MGPPRHDSHVHTRHSCDSKASLADYCEEAFRRGVSRVAFTDHVDHNPNDYGYGFYRAEAFFEELSRVREAYGDALTLLAGIEFSEPHVYRAEFERYRALPYDYIIGSVHWWYRDLFPSRMRREGVSAEVCYESYWREVRAAVAYGGFDALGHMDFPKRYYGELLYEEDEVREIFSLMRKNGIIPELNTSNLRRGGEPMPGEALLSLYRAWGGERIVFGSDAHEPADLCAGFDAAREMMRRHNLVDVMTIYN